MKLSKREWHIMDALWSADRALAARDVHDAVEPEYGWAYTTVKTMLDRLTKKEFVRNKRIGNILLYSPAVSRNAARLAEWRGFLGKAFGGEARSALRFLASESELTTAEREELRQLVERLDD